jgi:hypothetical protein
VLNKTPIPPEVVLAFSMHAEWDAATAAAVVDVRPNAH